VSELGPRSSTRLVHSRFPAAVGKWDTNAADLPGLYLRGGAIVPTGPVMNYVEKPLDPLALLIALDENRQAQGTLYEDAGDGYEYLQ
jgi:alpha-glucosidase (family GH31 glycosyl hydrolase)